LELQIKGNASGATRSVNNLIKTLEKLEKATAGGCGLSAVTTEMGKLQNISIGLSSSTKSTGASFGKLATSVTAAWIAMKKGSQMIASWIKESNEYVENLNLFTVSMGEYAKEAQEYAENVGEVLGLDPSTWMRNQGVFMTLATGFGVAGDRAATMSQQMTQLGYDLSSFFNIPVEEAMQKLKSGFAGELEPLRNLGYDLSQAKLEAIALSLGIDKSVSSMTQAEKAQLRYYAIMTQVTTAQGDMARTLDAPANQLRILQAQVTQAARALGNVFIPMLNAVLPYLIAAAKVVRLLANAIASLAGFSMPEIDYSSLGDVSAGAGAIGDGFEKAAGGAAKLNKTLLGIDELNVMSDSSGGGGGAGVGGGGGAFDFELPTYDFIGDAVSGRVNEIVEKMKEWLGITGDIDSWSDLFDTRLGTIVKTVGIIGAGFAAWKLANGFLSGVGLVKSILANPVQSVAIGITLTILGFTLAFDSLKDALENGLDGFNFADIIGGSLLSAGGAALFGKNLAKWITTSFAGSKVSKALTKATINLFGKTMGPVSQGAVAATGGVLAAAVSGIILGIPTFIVGIYDAIKNGIDWLSAVLIPAGSTAAAAGIGAIIGMLGGPIGAGVGALIGVAVGLVTDLVILIVQSWESITTWCANACDTIGEFFVDLWGGIVSVWNTVASWFNTNVIQPVVGFFSSLWTSVSGFFVNLWADIVAIFVAIPGWFDTNVIQPVVAFFKGLWDGISTTAAACWDAIVTFFSPAFQWFSKLFGSIWQTISDVFYNIGVIASGCWQIIKAVWGIVSQWFDSNIIQPVGAFFTNLWNGIQTTAINAWNGIKSAFAAIGSWINQYVIQPVSTFFTNLWNGIKTAAVTAWNGIQTVAINAWNGIKSVYATVTTWINSSIIQPVGQFFSNLWNGFINGAKNAWAGVKSVFSTVASFFQTTFQKAWAGVVKVFSTAGQIFVNIKDGILTAFKSIVNGIIGGLNSAIAIPFRGINTALNSIKNIKILGLSPFSGLRTISVPSIPYLAQGGIVDAGQLFIANESGPELVANAGRKTAVMNNDQIVDSVSQGVYQAVVAAMRANSGNEGGTQSVNVYLDGKQVYASMEQRRKERGASLMGNQVYSY
jgi:phage-related protein